MRNHTMKRLVVLNLMAAAFVVLAGCSADSPTAPKTPTPLAQNYAVTLSATEPAACDPGQTGNLPLCATIVATVTLGSGPAPDGTEVVFGTSFGSFVAGGVIQTATGFTKGGAAGGTLIATAYGTANVTATVKGASASRLVGFGVTPTQPPTTPTPGLPSISSLDPNQGSWSGGERVVVNGDRLFGGAVSFQIGPPVNATRDATTVLSTPDGTQLVILTPEASAVPLESNAVADVKVTTSAGSGILVGGFTYLAADLIPEIYAISPNSGPIAGGTRVTITGKGFQNPVQVLFGDRQAQVVSVNYNEIIVTSPSISPSEPNTPTVVQVTVKNVKNGQTSNGLPFRYGEAMFISSISPNEGYADEETLVTIFGQGFESPVRVMVGDVQAVVVSAGGTQIVARFPALPESARSCGDTAKAVEVTNINSNITATGPQFFYRAEKVLITSVTIDSGTSNLVQQYLPVNPDPTGPACSTPWNTHTLTINGSGFQRIGSVSAMVVRIQGVAGEFTTTFVSPNRLTLTLPDLDSINLDQVACVLNSGQTGARYIDTPVDLTVRNLRNSCEDTLQGAIIIRPCDTRCRLAWPLDVRISGSGSVATYVGLGVPEICADSCRYQVQDQSTVRLEATAGPPPPTGNAFVSWSCSGAAIACNGSTNATCGPFNMTAAGSCTANFGIPPTPTPP